MVHLFIFQIKKYIEKYRIRSLINTLFLNAYTPHTSQEHALKKACAYMQVLTVFKYSNLNQ